jgi:hypothetical protein
VQDSKKVTVNIPGHLLAKAQGMTGKGITQTIAQGLELLAASDTFNKVRQLRGKVRFSVKLSELREDR